MRCPVVFLVILFLCSALGSVGQTYVHNPGFDYEVIEFAQGDSFSYRAGSCTFRKEGDGTYEWVGDTLILDFEGPPPYNRTNEEKRNIEPIEWNGEEGDRKLILKLRHFESKEAIPFANVHVRAKKPEVSHKNRRDSIDDKKAEWWMESNEEGNAAIYVDDDIEELEVKVNCLQYKEVDAEFKMEGSMAVELLLIDQGPPDGFGYNIPEGYQKIFERVEENAETMRLREIKDGEPDDEVKKFIKKE